MRVRATLTRCTLVGMLVGFGPAVRLASGADCPARITFEPTAAATVDLGWTGYTHDMSLPGGKLDLATTCANSTSPCGVCAIDGVLPGFANPERCKDDPGTPCDPATEVADCGAPDSCRMVLGPPQPVNFAGFDVCLVRGVDAGGVTGTIDVESGALAATLVPEVAVFASGVTGCPRCLGDLAVDDGVAEGTCDSGPRAGDLCDANAVSAYSDYGPTSFGCPPAANTFAGRFSSPSLTISTGLQTMTLTADSPTCIGEPAKCFCGTCNNANAELCSVHADCPLSGGAPGVCNGKRCASGPNDGTPCAANSECPGGLCGVVGEPTRPNACLDDTVNGLAPCQDTGLGYGECTAGPVDFACTNHPNRKCLSDDQCDDVAGACQGTQRRCFLDNGIIGGSISVAGTATAPVNGIAEPITLGALGCASRVVDAFLDAGAGLPGPIREAQAGRLVFAGTAPTPMPTPLPGICPSAPAACRQPVVPRKTTVQINNRAPDAKDRLAFQWRSGAATSVSDFGDPVAGDDYALCVYDGSNLRTSIDIPGGGLCSGAPCWTQSSKGFQYKDKTGMAGGITMLQLQAGADGKAQIKTKGAGAGLALTIPPGLTGTMRVQVRNRTSGLCWAARFVPPFDKLDATTVKDRAD